MPLVYDESLFRALYYTRGGVTYGRSYADADAYRMEKRTDRLLQIGAVQNASVLFVGAAFGFEMEWAIDRGISDVWGIDPSPWVWANTQDVRADVLPRMVNATVGVDSTNDIRALLAAAGMPNPQRFDFIVTCDAISSQQNDAGINAFLDGCEGLLQGNQTRRIIHFVTPEHPDGRPQDSQILWKTMSDWAVYRPTHTWVSGFTWSDELI